MDSSTMVSFFRRLAFAFRAFFSILFRGRIADDIASALGWQRIGAPVQEPARGAPVPAAPPARDDAARAAQILALLQRDGRLVDFLMEEIASYPDAQIGAAVRDVHAGARQALLRYLTLDPVLDGQEGGMVTVAAGTNAGSVKVIGNVSGAPPFHGVLRHRGWQVRRVELPPLPASDRHVIAPAEVEVP